MIDDARSVFEPSGESGDLLENTEAVEERRELSLKQQVQFLCGVWLSYVHVL